MYVPRIWVKATAEEKSPRGKTVSVTAWGWGDDEASAKNRAQDRLQRALARARRGEPRFGKYAYGDRPLREEILETIEGSTPDPPAAIITRNSYGARVLNTARLLFLDIDFEPPGLIQSIRRLFGEASEQDRVLAALRDTLQRTRRATFRIYRTMSGLRAMAIDRDFDPAGSDVQELMQATGTDPAFAHLCLLQRSFRARLTPKPWHCRLSIPPERYPRPDGEARRRFAKWLEKYEKASRRYATCRYLETIGSGHPTGDARGLLELHDRVTRCYEPLPLA